MRSNRRVCSPSSSCAIRLLIAGWMFAVMRSCGWWVYVVYLPIFCIEAGLGDKVGGIALSITSSPWS